MPLYDYAILSRAGKPTGKYVVDVFQHINDEPHQAIDGKPVERVIRRAPAIERTWHGRETASMALRFDPDHIDEVKADVPDFESDQFGNAVFKSDKHQRKVYEQLAGAKARYAQQDADAGGGSSTATADDDSDLPAAAEALAKKGY